MGKLCQVKLQDMTDGLMFTGQRNFEIAISNYLHDFSEPKSVCAYKGSDNFSGYKNEVGILSHIDLETGYAEILIKNDYIFEHLDDFKLSFYIVLDPIKKYYKLTNPILVDITKYEI